MRLPIVGVMGSGVEPHLELSVPLGRLIAEAGCHLLTGGGDGVMAAVSEAFCGVVGRRGLSVGILRALRADPWMPAPPNRWVEVPIYTHLPRSGTEGKSSLSRNHINALSADLLFALPGGPGTLSEVELRLGYGRGVILFLGNQRIHGRTAGELVAGLGQDSLLRVAESIEECGAAIRKPVHLSLPQHNQRGHGTPPVYPQ